MCELSHCFHINFDQMSQNCKVSEVPLMFDAFHLFFRFPQDSTICFNWECRHDNQSVGMPLIVTRHELVELNSPEIVKVLF